MLTILSYCEVILSLVCVDDIWVFCFILDYLGLLMLMLSLLRSVVSWVFFFVVSMPLAVLLRSFDCNYLQFHLEYASSVWAPHTVKDIQALEGVQKFAYRMATHLWSARYDDLLSLLGLSLLLLKEGDLSRNCVIFSSLFIICAFFHLVWSPFVMSHIILIHIQYSSLSTVEAAVCTYKFTIQFIFSFNYFSMEHTSCRTHNFFLPRLFYAAIAHICSLDFVISLSPSLALESLYY